MEKNLQYPLDRRLIGLQTWYGLCWGEKNLTPSETQTSTEVNSSNKERGVKDHSRIVHLIESWYLVMTLRYERVLNSVTVISCK
jgi:hypothetical protein